MTRTSRKFIGVLLAVSFLIAACTSPAATTTPAAPANDLSDSSPSPATTVPPTSAPQPTATTVPPTDTPVPTETAAPTQALAAAGGDACLAGTWEMADMSDYFSSVMAKANTPFTIASKEGSVRLTFGPDGKASMTANQWKATLAGTLQGLTLNVVISINGSASADYAATADKITFSNRTDDNLVMSATLNGQELFSGSSSELGAMFGIAGSDDTYNTITYECDGNTLNYVPPIANARAVVLTRVQ
jgi:hypothetical protein